MEEQRGGSDTLAKVVVSRRLLSGTAVLTRWWNVMIEHANESWGGKQVDLWLLPPATVFSFALLFFLTRECNLSKRDENG
jgi:hypothetical protein